MAETLTLKRLRELARFRSPSECAISLYVDLDPAVTPTPTVADTRVSSLLSDAGKRIEAKRERLTHQEREGLERDLGRIREFYDNEFERDGARGVAVFVSGDYWSTLSLPDPVPDVVDLGRGFNIGPLAPHVGRGDGALVAFVGRERGQLFRLVGGRLQEVVDRTEEQPGRHDQGGWSQARYQRHIENLVAEHLRDVASELDQVVRNLEGPKVVVVGSDETRSEFIETLPHEVKNAVVGTTEAEAHVDANGLLAVVQPLLEEAAVADERAAIERWRERAAKGTRASSGWAETLEAASDARVELLLYEEEANKPAHECPKCGRASLEGGECALDGTPLEARDSGFDLAVHQTLLHGGSLLAVRHHVDLGPVEGLAALLRF
ncbi:MAG TPA: Vms1/Ankzf1 family peptidyl-tRNA hydrolase [Gaiellaceae bacterium]|nr:Vms1/Ankzf1 family peptidyl-tRNA hydrolase [Gaiellaceae bacterium]